MFERLAGFCVGIVTLFMLGVVGVVLFIPDAGRYMRIRSM